MHAPIAVHFHGIDKSETIEARVRQKVAKLAKHFGRMTSCRVVLEAPHRTPQRPKAYLIKIEIGVPSRRPVIISHEREGSHASEELRLAIRDAFESAMRKVDGVATQISQRHKRERGRRRPSAEVRSGE